VSKLNWRGGTGNIVAIADDNAIYSIQTLISDHILQAIDPAGVPGMGGTSILGKSFFDIDEAKARAQEIEDNR
jgi:hypothetical protein